MSKIAPSLFGSARSVVVPLEEVVEAVKERTSWPFMREVLKKNGIPPGNGWAILLANSDSPMADGVTVEQFLRKFHSEIVVSGERYVKVAERLIAPDGRRTFGNVPTGGYAGCESGGISPLGLHIR
jgi:hypothetical protein